MYTPAAEASSIASSKTVSAENEKQPANLSFAKFSEFFAIMGGLFGHRWTSQYGDDPGGNSAKVWIDSLNKLTVRQIAEGVKFYRAESLGEWPPTIPEFRRVCLGAPSIAQVKADIRNSTVTPFSLMVRGHIDTYRLKQSSQKDADRLIEDAYAIALADLASGKPLPQVNPQLGSGRKPGDKFSYANMTDEEKLYDRLHFQRYREMGYDVGTLGL